jgi:hypothetical protein
MQTNANQNSISYDDDDDYIDAYKIKINSNILLINDIIKENEKNKEMFDHQIKLLTEKYEGNLFSNNNKIDKLTKYNTTIKNMIDLKQQLLEMECEPLDLISSTIADEYKPVSNDLSILNIMKKAYMKQKEQADFNETIVENNELINAITNASFSSWCYYDSHNFKIKLEIDTHDYYARYKRDVLDTRYNNVYALTIKYPDNFPKLTNKAIIKYNNNELKNINNEKYRESVQNIEILISKSILIKINRCNAVPRGRKPKVSE